MVVSLHNTQLNKNAHQMVYKYHGFNDDGEVFGLCVVESDITASFRQVASSIAMLQIVVAYLTELGGVGWCVCMCMCASMCV